MGGMRGGAIPPQIFSRVSFGRNYVLVGSLSTKI